MRRWRYRYGRGTAPPFGWMIDAPCDDQAPTRTKRNLAGGRVANVAIRLIPGIGSRNVAFRLSDAFHQQLLPWGVGGPNFGAKVTCAKKRRRNRSSLGVTTLVIMRFVTSDSSPLDQDHAAFIQGSVSVIAASRNADNEPNLSRAIGCRVASDHRQVTLFFFVAQSVALLADLRSNGAIAVVFSEPSTHRTLQLKGTDATVSPLTEGDGHIIATYRQRLVDELQKIFFPESFSRALTACSAGDVVAVTFTVSAAFVQTPGPKAGTPLQTSA